LLLKKETSHRQFNKISLCLSPKAKEKKSALFALWAKQISFVNRRLARGRLEIDFKKPWNLLYFLPAEARAECPSEAENSSNRIWWCLLDEIRTHFEKNPLADF